MKSRLISVLVVSTMFFSSGCIPHIAWAGANLIEFIVWSIFDRNVNQEPSPQIPGKLILSQEQIKELALKIESEVMNAKNEAEDDAIQDSDCCCIDENPCSSDSVFVRHGTIEKPGVTINYLIHYDTQHDIHLGSSFIINYDNYNLDGLIVDGISLLDLNGSLNDGGSEEGLCNPCSPCDGSPAVMITKDYIFEGDVYLTSDGKCSSLNWDYTYTDTIDLDCQCNPTQSMDRTVAGSFGNYYIKDLLYDGMHYFEM